MVFTKSGNGGVVVDDPVFGVGMEFNGTGGYRNILSSKEYWEKDFTIEIEFASRPVSGLQAILATGYWGGGYGGIETNIKQFPNSFQVYVDGSGSRLFIRYDEEPDNQLRKIVLEYNASTRLLTQKDEYLGVVGDAVTLTSNEALSKWWIFCEDYVSAGRAHVFLKSVKMYH